MTLQLASSCSCRPGEALADGSTPEYFKTPPEAAQRVLEHLQAGSRYWAVHVRGQHVMGLEE